METGGYSYAALRRVRDRLLRYRSEVRLNGRKRSWQLIAEDIIDTGAVPVGDDDDDDPLRPGKVLGEALRRFAAGLQVPTTVRLDAICAFLKGRKYLVDEDLREAALPVQTVHGLHEFFGIAPASLAGNHPAPCGHFTAARHVPDGRNEYALLTIAPSGGDSLSVEETIHITNARTVSKRPAELRRFLKAASLMTLKHDGWLVEPTGASGLILMRDRLDGKARLCSLVHKEGSSGSPLTGIYLLRHLPFADPSTMLRIGQRPAEAGSTRAQIDSWLGQNVWYFERQEDP